MKLKATIKKLGMELDCELETRGDTPRAKQLRQKLAAARVRLSKLEDEEANAKAKN